MMRHSTISSYPITAAVVFAAALITLSPVPDHAPMAGDPSNFHPIPAAFQGPPRLHQDPLIDSDIRDLVGRRTWASMAARTLAARGVREAIPYLEEILEDPVATQGDEGYLLYRACHDALTRLEPARALRFAARS